MLEVAVIAIVVSVAVTVLEIEAAVAVLVILSAVKLKILVIIIVAVVIVLRYGVLLLVEPLSYNFESWVSIPDGSSGFYTDLICCGCTKVLGRVSLEQKCVSGSFLWG